MHLVGAQRSERLHAYSFLHSSEPCEKDISSSLTEGAEVQRGQVSCSKSHGPQKEEPGLTLGCNGLEFMLVTTRLLCCKEVQHLTVRPFPPRVTVKCTSEFLFPLYFKLILASVLKHLKLTLIESEIIVSSPNNALSPKLILRVARNTIIQTKI